MLLRDIENLSVEQLKQQSPALLKKFESLIETIKAAEGKMTAERLDQLSSLELFERYLRARLDAKMRDEKLAEQGRTITILNTNAELLNSELAKAKAEIDEQAATIEKIQTKREQLQDQLDAQVRGASAELKAIVEKLGLADTEQKRLGKLAADRRKALAGVMHAVNAIGAQVSTLLVETE